MEKTHADHQTHGRHSHESKDEHEPSHEKHKATKKNEVSPAIFALMGVFLLIIIFNQVQIFHISNGISEKIAAAKEASKVPQIQLTKIVDSSCLDCSTVEVYISAYKSSGANITNTKTLEFSSEEGKQLVAKYGITTIPTVIVTGEINRTQDIGLQKKGDALVSLSQPPYRDLSSNRIFGRVKMTIINDTTCKKCSEIGFLAGQIKSSGIIVTEEKVLDFKNKEAQELMKKYGITKLPTLLLSNDAGFYTLVQQAWAQVGTKETDGTYIVRNMNPPYKDVTTGELKGLISITFLNDASCTACYDAKDHLQILQGFGLHIDSNKSVDIKSKEGQGLASKYKMKAVPTVLIKGAHDYDSLTQAWSAVGSVESDNTYVFRNFANWPGHTYKDLESGQVVENPAEE